MHVVTAMFPMEGTISSAESAPTTATEGVLIKSGMSGVLWGFSGGTSGTADFYVYSAARDAWMKTGSQSITGNQAVLQQAAGDRALCILSTVSGNYVRDYQYLKD